MVLRVDQETLIADGPVLDFDLPDDCEFVDDRIVPKDGVPLEGVLPEDCEFIDDQIVEKPMGAESEDIAGKILLVLKPFARQNQLGRVFGGQTGYKCFPHLPRMVRKPDVSFVALAGMEGGRPPKGDFLIAPDLAVEVISPHDVYEDVERKVQDYFKAGVRLVWIVSPGSKTVLIRRLDGTCAALHHDGELSGEHVLPGFTCKVADLFA